MRLTIRIKKGRDGSAALTCTRADGTVTWQRQEGARAGFFPRHDLTHHAVETVLGHRRGFFGLVAEGWELRRLRHAVAARADPRGRGAVGAGRGAPRRGTRQRRGVERRGAGGTGGRVLRGAGIAAAPPAPTEEQLRAIRARMRELFAAWAALPPGEALELVFDAGS